jgi:hypothetical protein
MGSILVAGVRESEGSANRFAVCHHGRRVAECEGPPLSAAAGVGRAAGKPAGSFAGSLVGGQRSARAQLCLSNEEMRRELTRNALEWLRRDPAAGMISVAQNDCGGACQCPDCRRVVEEEGAESRLLIRFVNQVAADIEKEFPDTLVETLAYQYTRTPPKHPKPRGNVVVRLCTIECSFSQPLATGPQNAALKADIDGWAAVAPRLYVWDYVTNFSNYLCPHPNFRVLAPNLRCFVDQNAIGLFEQGHAACSCNDFPELRAWLLAHLLGDPSRDDKALLAEFMRGYYGAAAEPLTRYLDLICDAVERNRTPSRSSRPPSTPPSIWASWT